jgi:hypothetical protein
MCRRRDAFSSTGEQSENLLSGKVKKGVTLLAILTEMELLIKDHGGVDRRQPTSKLDSKDVSAGIGGNKGSVAGREHPGVCGLIESFPVSWGLDTSAVQISNYIY